MKIFLVFLSSIALVACGSGSNSPSSITTPTPTTTTTPKPVPITTSASTLSDTIRALEKSGKLPTLDRSASISGPDTNANGVRDDIDAYLAAQNYTAPQLKSAQQMAKAMADILHVDTTDQNALRASDLNLQKSINCMYSKFTDPNQAHTTGKNIEKMTANTKARVEAYIKYQVAMNGKVLASPQGESCE